MPTKSVVNLVGVYSGFSLMITKKMLLDINPGERIHILLQDPEVIDDLNRIIDNSKDEIINILKEQDHFKISIQKG